MHKDKNKTFKTDGNTHADKLFYLLENVNVISDNLKEQIKNILYIILTNYKGNENLIKEQINQLHEDLEYIDIFSNKFKAVVLTDLKLASLHESTKN